MSHAISFTRLSSRWSMQVLYLVHMGRGLWGDVISSLVPHSTNSSFHDPPIWKPKVGIKCHLRSGWSWRVLRWILFIESKSLCSFLSFLCSNCIKFSISVVTCVMNISYDLAQNKIIDSQWQEYIKRLASTDTVVCEWCHRLHYLKWSMDNLYNYACRPVSALVIIPLQYMWVLTSVRKH